MLNQCAFFGRLTADPEIRQVGENSVVGKFTIAVGTGYSRKRR